MIWFRTALPQWAGPRSTVILRLLTILLVCAMSHPSWSDDSETPSADSKKTQVDSALPASFDALESIYFYQSQSAELLPSHYRPIDIQTLDEKLKGRKQNSGAATDTPQIVRAVYVARVEGEHLVSNQSYLEVAYDGSDPARLMLSKVGIALTAPSDNSIANASAIVTDATGLSSIQIAKDSRVSFGWSAAGTPSERGLQFDLQLPVAGQAKLLIEVPISRELVAMDGVGQQLPSPPLEATTVTPLYSSSEKSRWYSIEAGGLSRVRLRVTETLKTSTEAVIALRQASLQYDLMPASITFTARMLLDAKTLVQLPPLLIQHGHITSVRVGGTALPWSELPAGEGSELRFDTGRSSDFANSSNGTVSLVIEGESAWSSAGGGTQNLPWPTWKNRRPILIPTEMQAQIRVDSTMRLARLQLPSGWRYLPTLASEDGSRLYRCVGPISEQGLSVLSRPYEVPLSAESVLRLSATSSRFNAQYDTSLAISTSGPVPIQLRIDRDWKPELVTVVSSGRVLDLPSDEAARRNVIIWPTSDEVINGRLQLRITGSMPQRIVGGRSEFPATSFVQLQNVRNRVAAAVTPPPGFSWTGEVALRASQINVNALTSIQKELLGEVRDESLLIDLNEGRLPLLVSRRPDAALTARNRLVVRFDGEQINETLLIACESSTTDIQSIVVDLGARGQRPEMQWSAVLPDGNSRRIESLQRVTPENVRSLESNQGRPSAEPEQTSGDASTSPLNAVTDEDTASTDMWQLLLGEPGERRLLLVGRRTYPLDRRQHLPLPFILGAAGQTSDALISPSLAVDQLSGSIQKVPLVESTGASFKAFAALAPDIQPDAANCILRYEAAEKPWIELSAATSLSSQPIVSQETVRIVASNRGGDWLVGCYEFAYAGTLVIDQDPSLRLISVTNQSDEPLPFEESEHQLRISPQPNDRCVFLKWSRPTVAGSLVRRWTTPKLNSNAVVLQRDWRLIAAADTLIPRILMDGQPDRDFHLQKSFAELLGFDWLSGGGNARASASIATKTLAIQTMRQRFLVVDATLGFPVMAMFALWLFALGWWLAGKKMPIVLALWGVSLIPGIALLPDTHVWFGTICLPLACGGLIAVCQRQRRPGNPSKVPANSTTLGVKRGVDGLLGSANSGRERPSSRAITWSAKIGILVLAAGALLSMLSKVHAQDSNIAAGLSPKETPEPAKEPARPLKNQGRDYVLIPTDETGKPSGSKVYIDQSLYSQLYRDQLPTTGTVRLRSANYRVRLDGAVDAKPQAEVEARLLLEDSAQRAELSLPFRSSEVKSVQWLTDRDTRALRWLADSESSIRITLPSATNATVLIRANLEVTAPVKLTKRLTHKIVPVPGATLLVDAGAAVQRIELANCLGRRELQNEAGRLTASIGAVDTLDLSVVYRDPSRTQPVLLERRYWVHAGHQSTNIECEADLSDSELLQGTELSLVISDGAVPQIMTDEWSLVTSESVTPSRRQLQLRATKDNPGPLRFLWEMPSVVVPSQRTDLPASLTLPDLFTFGATNGSPSTIAFDAAPGLRLAVFTPASTAAPVATPATDEPFASSTRSETIDAFVSRWKGFRATASEIISTKTLLPRLVITAPNPNLWQSDEEHHLHVRPGELQLSYTARITPGDRLLGPTRLIIPPNCELRLLTVNQVAVDSVPYRIGNRDEIVLNEMSGNEPIQLRAVLHMRIPQSGRFNPPRMSIEPAQVVRGTYTMTRDQSLAVQELLPNGILETNTPQLSINQQLTGGWIPCWSWKLDEFQSPGVVDTSRKPQLNGVYRVEPRNVVAECQQVNLLKWEQSRWMFESHIRIENTASNDKTGDAAIDFVNIELPTSWCENLAIEPDVAWSRQPAIDPSTQIVRIRPIYSPGDRSVSLVLRGWRLADSESRIEVPSIRVLGVNKRDVYISVPQAIEGRSLDWEAHSALDAKIPEDWLTRLNQNAVLTGAVSELQLDPAAHTYLAIAGNATVKLVPSREQASSPVITLADIKLLTADSEQIIALHRWDLSPSWQEEMVIDMPDNATIRGVWIDDHATTWSKSANKIVIPLVYSRLAQAVTVIYQEPTARVNHFLLARVEDVEVQQTWLTVMQSKADGRQTKTYIDAATQWHTESTDSYELNALKSVNRVAELSLANTADRSQDEVATWLKPWAQRVTNLLASSNLAYVDDKKQSLAVETTVDTSQFREERERLLNQWQQYLTQFDVDSESLQSSPAIFSPAMEHWQLAGILRVDGQPDATPAFHLVSSSSQLAWTIRLLLCLALMIGLLIVSHRMRYWFHQYGYEAAIWLFAIGISSLAVAPVPVAVAICLVAVTLPWLNQMQQRRAGA